jgi:hypothetical protein
MIPSGPSATMRPSGGKTDTVEEADVVDDSVFLHLGLDRDGGGSGLGRGLPAL